MDSQKSIILKVQKILFDEVYERGIVSACIPINVIFSEVLTSLNIPHTVKVGYSNFKPHSSSGGISVWHVWVHAFDAIFDVPLITTRQLVPSFQVLGQPDYSVQSLYEVIDEDTESERHTKRCNQQIMEYYAHTPTDIWSYMEKNFEVLAETQRLRKSIYNTFGLAHYVQHVSKQ